MKYGVWFLVLKLWFVFDWQAAHVTIQHSINQCTIIMEDPTWINEKPCLLFIWALFIGGSARGERGLTGLYTAPEGFPLISGNKDSKSV